MLLNPNHLTRKYPDRRSGEIMAATVDFFESRGKARLKHDDHERIWYSDFLDFVGRERIFASLLTPASYGADDCRWDTYRISEFAEIMGFYGLSYWYPFQVTALGLGPIWMSANEDAKRKAAAGLEAGEVFAFGLSEQTHGADVYQTDMILTPSDGGWTANGEKYYIGNANVARMVSTFGKIAGTPESQEYVFFVADSQHERYDLIKNVVNSQNYVANYALRDYPVTEADILHRGAEAFHAALNTVNVCKYNLGWGAIGMCTHALYESVTHAANRHLYGTVVTDFSHVRRLLTDAYVRLIAMKLVASRASDYMRSASAADRRYLLYSPLTKAKVTSEGERVITALWDVIAAKGVEKDTFFETVAREIGLLPRLEGTVHINIGLLGKFMPNYLFAPDSTLPVIPRRDDAADDAFLFGLNALSADPSPAAQVRASVTYNHIVEGMLALTGYYAWHKICVERAILPGMQELVRRIGDDERRHMAWGTFTCRRHVAADDANWTVFETRMNELIPLALRLIEEGFALYGDQPPFDLSKDDFLQYSTDKGMRRFGTISNARGRPVAEIDVDYSPAQLEDTFADEDRRTLAAASA